MLSVNPVFYTMSADEIGMHKEHALLPGKQYVNENRDEETDWDVARGHNLQTGIKSTARL